MACMAGKPQPFRACAFDTCGRRHYAKTYCLAHYQQIRSGREITEPLPIKGASVEARIEYYSMPLTECGCSVWTGAVNEHGYAILRVERKTELVHRLAFESEFGPIPPGVAVDHKCRVRSCININHLRIATPEQNAWNRKRLPNRSGYRNVYPNRNGWIVKITHKGKSHNFGTYADVHEAGRIAIERRAELFAEFSGLA